MAVPTTDTDMGMQPGRLWWVPLVAGLLSLIIGLVALFYPGPTLLVVGVLFGGYLVIWASMLLVHAASDAGVPTVARVLLIIFGILGILTGLLLIVRPGQSVVTAAWLLGFWWTLGGIMQLVEAIAVPGARLWHALRGVLGLIAGIIILASPEIGLVTLVLVVGIGLIIQGVIEIAAGWELRRLHKEGVL